MSNSNISKRLAQVKPGTLHAGVDLALEKNVMVVVDENARQCERFSCIGFNSVVFDLYNPLNADRLREYQNRDERGCTGWTGCWIRNCYKYPAHPVHPC